MYRTFKNVTEEAILAGLRKGESSAVQQIYTSAFEYCASVVTRNQGQLEDAQDIFQEAIMVLYRQCQESNFELSCAVKTYLYSITRNLWLKRLRSGSKFKTIDLNESTEHIVPISEDESEALEIREEKYSSVIGALKLLKEECQRLLKGYYFNKKDLSTLAEELGYTYQFIKVKKNRCMGSLRKMVDENNKKT